MKIQLVSVVHRAICPTFVYDDTTRIILSIIGITLGLIVLWRISRYFNN